jgi:magnesium chelatase family protein
MLATTNSATLFGVNALAVTVEANSGERGEPKCVLVGLPDASVKESMDRVFSSLSNNGYSKPRTHVTINLAPADLRKEGSSFDLPIALTLLAATKQFEGNDLSDFVVAGELGLSGEIRKVRGGLAMGMLAQRMGKRGVLLPPESAQEACLVEGIEVYAINSLSEAICFFEERSSFSPLEKQRSPFLKNTELNFNEDFSEIKGQYGLRRAVEIAVAGGHNLLIIGPPGAGKSMIAKRIPTILPDLRGDELLEILNIYSIQGDSPLSKGKGLLRPVRTPHHTISDVGLLGGGTIPGPGEISLAHNGVLFLDELPEFKRSALEVLRQPLEDGKVTISRSAGKITLPSDFMLVAAMNPCPCGFMGDEKNSCRCSIPQIQKYRAKISGPLLDRIDIHIETPAVNIDELQNLQRGEPSADIRGRIQSCRKVQESRFTEYGLSSLTNANIPERLMDEVCQINNTDKDLLKKAMEQLSLSARAYSKILKLARTIADLETSLKIQNNHLLEAIQYRSLDRNV